MDIKKSFFEFVWDFSLLTTMLKSTILEGIVNSSREKAQ